MPSKINVNKQLETKFAPGHPVKNEKAAKKLLQFVEERMETNKAKRERLVDRLTFIDKQIAGFLRLSDADQKRRDEQLQGESVKPVDVNLQLVWAQIDEAVTYLMSVFAPDTQIYNAVAPKDLQPVADAFALLLNQQADKQKYYRYIAMVLLDCMKYNIGGMRVEWLRIIGKRLANNEDGSVREEQGLLWQGNEIEAVDLYNFAWDPAVDMPDLADKGEWCAMIDAVTGFQLRRMAEKGELYGLDRLKDFSNTEVKYYKVKPEIRHDLAVESNGRAFNWISHLSGRSYNTIEDAAELIKMYAWLIPADYKISANKDLTLCRIYVLNSKYIVNVVELNNTHSKLPFAFGMPIEDNLKLEQKGISEMLIPLQIFASFLMNVHQKSSRKSLYGMTVYDPSFFDFSQLGDDVSGRIPVNPNGYGKDLRNHYIQDFDAPGTEDTLSQISQVIELMQHLLPTDMLKQVASLERATEYQAAATVQGGNRRNQKLARILDAQLFSTARDLLMYNVFQYQEAMDILKDDGTTVVINPAQFREANISFVVQEGLKSIDKLVTMTVLERILTTVIQSREAMEEFDIVALLDYFSSLAGDTSDLSRFRRSRQGGAAGAQSQAGGQGQANTGGVPSQVTPPSTGA